MIETYIYLNATDKAKLTKTAQNKQLSLSTYINIIVKNYINLLTEEQHQKYINKGNSKTHIKLRAKEYKANSIEITNAVYKYLHSKELKEQLNFEKVNRYIQSETDKTIDANFQKNMIIRITYRFCNNKGQ